MKNRGCKKHRILRGALCLLALLSLSVFALSALRGPLGIEDFADSYQYRWAKSDQPETIEYGPEWRKKFIKSGYAAPFAGLSSKSLRYAVPAFFGMAGESPLFKRERAIGETEMGLGVSFDRGEDPKRTVELLKEAGVKTALVRVPDGFSGIYSGMNGESTRQGINALIANGVEVVISIPQSREAVLNPEKWAGHLRGVLAEYYPRVRYYIPGHAPNRVKWGVWDYNEYLTLFGLAVKEIRKYEGAKIIGPSVIDFEWFWTAGLLWGIPPEDIDIPNTLLYVDRRGAPENTQAGLDFAGKIEFTERMFKAWKTGLAGGLWITEANWPIDGQGDFAPASGGVDEETYADYMVRYHIIALSSGAVERVYWWRLSAKGYGLLESLDPSANPRPAWPAYVYMKKTLDGSWFLRAEAEGGRHAYYFGKNVGAFYIVWDTTGSVLEIPSGAKVYNISGTPVEHKGKLPLGGSPVYVFPASGLNRQTR